MTTPPFVPGKNPSTFSIWWNQAKDDHYSINVADALDFDVNAPVFDPGFSIELNGKRYFIDPEAPDERELMRKRIERNFATLMGTPAMAKLLIPTGSQGLTELDKAVRSAGTALKQGTLG